MMGVSRAVQRVVCLERAAWQDKFSELCTQLAAKDDVIVQLRAQLTVRARLHLDVVLCSHQRQWHSPGLAYMRAAPACTVTS